MHKTTLALAALLSLMAFLPTPVRSDDAKPASPISVWTNEIVQSDLHPTSGKELKPLHIVATRNGTFSGKVVLESGNTIKGIKADITPLAGPGGTIPADNVQLRYAKHWEKEGWALPNGPDILEENPVDVPPVDGRAVAPVWISIHVPKDAKADSYKAEITVQANGLVPTKVPLEVEVVDWTLPDPQNYRTVIDFVESPDTLALEYKVPLWSDKHFQLIDRSFKLLSPTGARTLYIPLIVQTNLGNEQSMVRWIPRGDNKYDYDFSVMDRYLDSAEKNLGHPKLVILQVWDICMSAESLDRGLWGGENDTRKAREELLHKGPRVTAIDPKTKETSVLTLPRYEDPASKALWQPMFTELRKHMAQRGLDKSMMLGLMPDLWPTKPEVQFWNDLAGKPVLPWAIHGHAGPIHEGLYKIAPIGYAAYVYELVFNVNPEKFGHMYGWKNDIINTNYLRGGELNASSAIDIREFPAFNITGGQRGCGRMGADFWQAIRNKRGERAAAVYTRYPENMWRNLDISDWFLAPGPDSAVATARLASLKEGVQECEARIFIEDALTDPAKKSRLGAELADRAQKTLDELHHAMWKTVWNNDEDLTLFGKIGTGRNPPEGLWNALLKAGKIPTGIDPKTKKPGPLDFWWPEARQLRSDNARDGQAWFVKEWKDRERKLFAVAGEVAKKLH